MTLLTRAGVLAGVTAGCLLADVTYTETTKYTGGTLLEMMQRMASNPIMSRLAGGGMKTAFQDQTSTVYVKGAKMARIGNSSSTMFDLDAGTMTNINNEKRTYSVETFEDLRQRMDQMQQRMNRGGSGDLQFDVKVDKTGKTRNIKDQTAGETVMTLTAKNASSQGQMVVKVDAWLAPATSSTKELAEFQRKLAQKIFLCLCRIAGFGSRCRRDECCGARNAETGWISSAYGYGNQRSLVPDGCAGRRGKRSERSTDPDRDRSGECFGWSGGRFQVCRSRGLQAGEEPTLSFLPWSVLAI